MYTKTFSEGTGGYKVLEGFEIAIPMPDMPPLDQIENHGLPLEEQIFRREVLPIGLDRAAKSEQKPIVDAMWHLRRNGKWVFIKGKPYYIPGKAWFFFNFWHTELGPLPEFRMEALEYWWIADYVASDPNCLGIFDIKPRRIGDTEKALCESYEEVTRYRKSWFGMQNRKDDDAEANYDRVITAHQQMPFFFKPTNTSTSAPKGGIFFDYPSSRSHVKGSRHIKHEIAPLRSRIDFKPTKKGEYDGKRLRRYHMDEPGKVSSSSMNVLEQWEIVKQCLTLNQGKRVVGKAHFTTTVELMSDGSSLLNCEKLWDWSNPNERNANGQTISGLYRVFRGYKKTAECDMWGFHKEAEAEVTWTNTINDLIAKNDFDAVSRFKRKFPSCVEDSFSVQVGDSVYNGELISQQRNYITNVVNTGVVDSAGCAPVRGFFSWSNGFGSKVIFTPDPNGKWEIVDHPEVQNEVIKAFDVFMPKREGVFCAGIDGIDHGANSSAKGSDGAIVIKRLFNPLVDQAVEYSEDGRVLNPHAVKTNKYVAVYRDRPHDPTVFYENAAMGLFYYAAMAFIERDKPGVIAYLKRMGMQKFLAYKPTSLGIGQKEKEVGVKGSATMVSAWVGLTKAYLHRYTNCVWFVSLLEDFRKFSAETRGKCDLAVAAGYCEILADQYNLKRQREEKNAESDGWDKIKW